MKKETGCGILNLQIFYLKGIFVMIFSYCINLDLERAKAITANGFTGYEFALSAAALASDEEFNEFAAAMKEYGLPCVSANGMFLGDAPILAGKAGYSQISEYLERMLPKAKSLNTPVIVLGSGSARSVPEGMSREEATDRFCSLLTDVVSPTFEKYGITVAVEELRASECNFINTCGEAAEIVHLVNRPNIRLLVDYFHATLGGDTVEEISKYKDDIAHVHIASPKNNRHAPNENDYEDCREFFAMLKRIGYNGAISIEGPCDDFPVDSKIALDVMTRAWNAN